MNIIWHHFYSVYNSPFAQLLNFPIAGQMAVKITCIPNLLEFSKTILLLGHLHVLQQPLPRDPGLNSTYPLVTLLLAYKKESCPPTLTTRLQTLLCTRKTIAASFVPVHAASISQVHFYFTSASTSCTGIVQTAEYGKCTPEIFFLKCSCTLGDGCGRTDMGVARVAYCLV